MRRASHLSSKTKSSLTLIQSLVALFDSYQNSGPEILNYNKTYQQLEKIFEELNEFDFHSEAYEIFTNSVKTFHPQFNNQLTGGLHPYALAGELLTAILNSSMSTYEISPVGTVLEKLIIRRMNEQINAYGWDGIMTSGGSNSNMLALHHARFRFDPSCKESGNQNYRFKVFVSEDSHYSFSKALNSLGMGTNSLVKVGLNQKRQMDPIELKEKIKSSLDLGEHPLAICSTAGTTVFGAFDPINKIQEIAREYSLWHHIDAAWGGPVVFNKNYSKLMDGCAQVDSITWDFHKLMGAGITSSLYVSKHKDSFYLASSGGGESYLFNHDNTYNTGEYSLQCGRRMDSVKLWLHWRANESEGFSKLVEGRFELIRYFQSLLEASPRFKVLLEPEYLNLCFQKIPADISMNIGEYNNKIRTKLIEQGRIMINTASTKETGVFFRFVAINNQTTKEHIDELFATLSELE